MPERDGSPYSDGSGNSINSYVSMYVDANGELAYSGDEVYDAPLPPSDAGAMVRLASEDPNEAGFYAINHDPSTNETWIRKAFNAVGDAAKATWSFVQENPTRAVRLLADAAPNIISGIGSQFPDESYAAKGLKGLGAAGQYVLATEGAWKTGAKVVRGEGVDWAEAGIALGTGYAASGPLSGAFAGEENKQVGGHQGAAEFVNGVVTFARGAMHYNQANQAEERQQVPDIEAGDDRREVPPLDSKQWPDHYKQYAKYIWNDGRVRPHGKITWNDGKHKVKANPDKDDWLKWYADEYVHQRQQKAEAQASTAAYAHATSSGHSKGHSGESSHRDKSKSGKSHGSSSAQEPAKASKSSSSKSEGKRKAH
ncbi:hypothetical protein [Streptomyces sp. NPDC048172]|uniref:hypothetical protein n=1 Tax=Streptomyces sp. NPDC048172 TaxID=3365505 RepID=UPI0037223A71